MNFKTNQLTWCDIRKTLLLFLTLLLSMLLTGCSGLSQLPPNDSTYFRIKIETALAQNGSIKDMVLLDRDGKRIVLINLNLAPENEENYSLKAMRALSGDPLIPSIDELCIAVEQTQSIAYSRQLLIAALQGAMLGASGRTGPVNTATEEKVTTFSACSHRAALLKGEDPIVGIRNGFHVSGPYKGQSTNSLWLTEERQ